MKKQKKWKRNEKNQKIKKLKTKNQGIKKLENWKMKIWETKK